MAPGSYFKRTSYYWIAAITASFGYFTLIVFAPDVIPYDCLGPLGSVSSDLVYYHADLIYKGWWAAVAVHVLEAAYAYKLCSEKGINYPPTQLRWVVQTFLFGYASLGMLIKYNPKRHKRY